MTKRAGETHFEWQCRIAYLNAIVRDAEQPLITPEAEQHARYETGFVRHVESNTMAHTRRNTTASQLEVLHSRGGITAEQLVSSEEIESVICVLTGDVGYRSVLMQMRVDQGHSPVDPGAERIAIVRAQAAYTLWRQRLPMPRRLVIDMIMLPQALVATARSYGVGWAKAKKRLSNALDEWPRVKERVWENVDEDTVQAVFARIRGIKSQTGLREFEK